LGAAAFDGGRLTAAGVLELVRELLADLLGDGLELRSLDMP
jgi:hypothetical protein